MKNIKLTYSFIFDKSFWYLRNDIHRFWSLGNEVLWILFWKQILDEMNKSLRSTYFLQWGQEVEHLYNLIFMNEIEVEIEKYLREGWQWTWMAPFHGLEFPADYKEVSWTPVFIFLFPGCGCNVTGCLTCLSWHEKLYPPILSQRKLSILKLFFSKIYHIQGLLEPILQISQFL